MAASSRFQFVFFVIRCNWQKKWHKHCVEMRVNHHTSEQNLLRRRRFHINRDYNSKKNKCFFRCCSYFTAKEYYLITEKKANKWIKIHFFCWLMTVRFFCAHFACAMCQCVSILMQFWMLPLFFDQILTFSWHHQCLPVWYWAKSFAFAWIFNFFEFLFWDEFLKKNSKCMSFIW